ncbi:hypothetical protein KUH03_40230 [Sphingobacterium sp. E70]|nr:hypothetical protein KUH03_40230 [Sphingobacterium sp. E70]
MEKFYAGQVLEKNTTNYLYQLMVECSRGLTWMKAGLPEGTELVHRTGISDRNENDLRAAMNDVGIFKLPNGNHIVLSVYLKDITEEREVTEKNYCRHNQIYLELLYEKINIYPMRK